MYLLEHFSQPTKHHFFLVLTAGQMLTNQRMTDFSLTCTRGHLGGSQRAPA